MTHPRGFLQIGKKKERDRDPAVRVHDWREIVIPGSADEVREQATRCMDCGVPFCHRGCPLGNLIPEWNELVSGGRLEDAAKRLALTNNFPEITGRVCPAPCEASCVLAIPVVGSAPDTPEDPRSAPLRSALLEQSVTIKTIERTIADAERARGLVPRPAHHRTGKKAAVVGSGPAGLAAAQELARAGHDVTVFERDDRVGGLLRYGIPDFKLEKSVIDQRVLQMKEEGVEFRCGVSPTKDDLAAFDAIVLAVGSRRPRDLDVPGRNLSGVRFAMDYLEEQNRRVAGDHVDAPVAEGKRVVVIGGGDTGSDCVGTAIRQGAKSVVQLEIMPKPGDHRAPTNPWPEWPLVLRTSSSHEECGAALDREWAIKTRSFIGDGNVQALVATRIDNGEAIEIPCDLVLLAMGFVGPEPELATSLGCALDARGNVKVGPAQETSVQSVFACGDASRGQSLVVWAIADGRRAAASANAWLRTLEPVLTCSKP